MAFRNYFLPFAFAAAALLANLPASRPALSQDTQEPPRFHDPGARKLTPPTESITQIRFVTTPDFPPLNAIGPSGNPEGFNVEIARQVCATLALTERCQIQALPFDEAVAALTNGTADAMIAGLSVSETSRKTFAFSQPYLALPARFVARTGSPAATTPGWSGKRVGVMAGSAHERMLRDYFPTAKAVTYSRTEWIREDLVAGKIDAALGDGMREAIWLAGQQGQACCAFVDGPYLAPEYFGFGLAIAVARDRADLVTAFDFALAQMESSGTSAEIYRRYFPVSFF